MHQKNQFGQPIGLKVDNWSSRQNPAKEKIHGNYCILEPLEIDLHAKELFEALQFNNQGETWTYLPYGPFEKFTDFREWLMSVNAEADTILFIILEIKTKQPLGICAYLRINPTHGSIEVGHLHYSKLMQKTPIATEAMFLMMKNAFDALQYRRYEWKCNSLNEASCNAALRLGFKFEGIFRQSNVFKDHSRDTAWYSIIDSEWPAIKARFQKWLDPNNFDANGKQVLKIAEV